MSAAPLNLLQNNLRAIFLMIAAMGFFAVEDAIIKAMSASISVGQILFVLSSAGFLIFAAIIKMQRKQIFIRALLTPPIIARNIGDVIAALLFVTALSLMPLSNASAILQATPLAVTMGAALFLGETVGWRRWTAILVGFLGVIIIIRPGMEGFNSASILALIAVIGLSIRDLATRRITAELSTLQVSASAFLALTVPSFLLMLHQGGWQTPDAQTTIFLIAASLVGPLGYYVITVSLRIGETSAVAPFRYSRLVFAIILGFIVFGEQPDLPMLLGSALVIGSGIYAIYRERVIKTAR